MASLVLVYGPMRYRKVIVNDFGIGDWKLSVAWVVMISILVPLAGVGLIVWWAYDHVRSNKYWYHLTLDTMTTTLLEWLFLFVILLIANGIALFRKRELFRQNKHIGYDPHHPDYTPVDSLECTDLRCIVVSSFSLSTNKTAPIKSIEQVRID
ncbi:uncharacterized protein DEA37_0003317 [Paragonimus westermani]|uniref:Uncharacterized protein n=1 Tax=Paragonimus westermani TaxID=34504 RepID=A0A5J4N7T6_9TREM|nr:uncharacterized protein DEA37_0003317 [Paragonimus westermani]